MNHFIHVARFSIPYSRLFVWGIMSYRHDNQGWYYRRPDRTKSFMGSYCARIIKGPTKTVRKAQSLQSALKKPAVYSPKVGTGQRRDLLRAESIIEVLSVLARHSLVQSCTMLSKNGQLYELF